MSGPSRKPQADVFTVLLALALVAVIIATIFAYLETADYGEQKYRGAPTVQMERPQTAPWRYAARPAAPTAPWTQTRLIS